MAQTQVPVRLPDDIVKRVDKYIERMRQIEPGLLHTRAAAVRSLVMRGLAAVEKSGKK